MTLKHDIRVWLVAAGLQATGRRKVAGLVRSSWRLWKLYNTSAMDFHLFFCSRNLVELQVGAVSLALVMQVLASLLPCCSSLRPSILQ